MYEQLHFIVETVVKVFQNSTLAAEQVAVALPGGMRKRYRNTFKTT